jgi:hypothetical protein
MNDQQMQALLDTWYREREIPRPKVQTSVASVMANLPQTRQQGRWLPFPLFRRKAQTPTATDTAEYRPMPMPTTNGHAPTVIGRTQTMFSPVKAVTAGALVFALGGMLLIAQPFDQQEAGIPGAQPPELSGVTVTVTQQCEDVGHAGCDWTASDPRLTGIVAVDWGAIEGVSVDGAGESDAGFIWMDGTFEGPEGGWTSRVYTLWGEPTQSFLVLSGTGANEGWQYIASSIDPESDGDFDWTGTLYQGELPPFPEAPAE